MKHQRRRSGAPCYLKRKYENRGAALTALAEAVRSIDSGKVPIRFYRCSFCRGWHLTSQNKRKGA